MSGSSPIGLVIVSMAFAILASWNSLEAQHLLTSDSYSVFDVSIPSVAIGDIIIPATKGKCSGGSRREASQCTRDDTAEEDNSILYTVEAYAANHTFMLSYLFHSRERYVDCDALYKLSISALLNIFPQPRSKSFNVTAYGDAYLSQSWRNSTFKILPSSITEIQTCLNHLAPCPAQSPPAANFWPPDPSEYVFSIVDWNVSQVAYTQGKTYALNC